MAELSSHEAHRVARRLFLIQVLLNYRTMQGGGYLFALWPWVRRQEKRAELVQDISGYINSHPVFAALAVGAIRKRLDNSKLETQKLSPGEAAAEFTLWRESLAGPLGMTGDALIWDRWKPLVLAAGAWLLLLMPSVAVWMIVASACVLLYNIPLYAFRVWGVKRGYALGEKVLTILRDQRFAQWQRRLTIPGTILAGVLFGTGIFGGSAEHVSRGVQFLVALAVMFLGLRLRFSAATASLAALVAALAFPIFP